MSLSLDSTLSNTIRTHVISFLISAFQSLDSGIVRKECAPLVSIGIWHNLATEAAREQKLAQYPQFKRPWRAATKKYEAADEATKARLRFERGWLFALMIDFAARLHELTEGELILIDYLIQSI